MIILSFILAFFCQSAYSLNLVYKMPGYTTELKNDSEAVEKILSQYEWPSSINWISDQGGKVIKKAELAIFSKAFTGKKNAETNFIAERLKSVSSNLKVIFIPQTLYEIFRLLDLYEHGSDYSKSERQDFTRHIFNTIKSIRKTLNYKTLDFSNEKENTKLLLSLLERFNKKSKYLDDPISIELKDGLTDEIRRVKDKSSPLLAAINAEVKAQEDNRVLLYRGTRGVPLTPAKKVWALDFPVREAKSLDLRQEGTVAGAIKHLNTMIKEEELRSVDISFQYSLFGGCLEDQGICPFSYWSEYNNDILYAISLTRYFAQTRAKQIIFFPALNADDLLNSEGILGHPRFRLIGPFRFPFDEMLGGKAFKFGYYKPLEHWAINNRLNTDNKKYFSYLIEVATILTRNSIVLGIESEKPINPAFIIQGQKTALEMLIKGIKEIKESTR